MFKLWIFVKKKRSKTFFRIGLLIYKKFILLIFLLFWIIGVDMDDGAAVDMDDGAAVDMDDGAAVALKNPIHPFSVNSD
jgi:hypothetical protein